MPRIASTIRDFVAQRLRPRERTGGSLEPAVTEANAAPQWQQELLRSVSSLSRVSSTQMTQSRTSRDIEYLSLSLVCNVLTADYIKLVQRHILSTLSHFSGRYEQLGVTVKSVELFAGKVTFEIESRPFDHTGRTASGEILSRIPDTAPRQGSPLRDIARLIQDDSSFQHGLVHYIQSVIESTCAGSSVAMECYNCGVTTEIAGAVSIVVGYRQLDEGHGSLIRSERISYEREVTRRINEMFNSDGVLIRTHTVPSPRGGRFTLQYLRISSGATRPMNWDTSLYVTEGIRVYESTPQETSPVTTAIPTQQAIDEASLIEINSELGLLLSGTALADIRSVRIAPEMRATARISAVEPNGFRVQVERPSGVIRSSELLHLLEQMFPSPRYQRVDTYGTVSYQGVQVSEFVVQFGRVNHRIGANRTQTVFLPGDRYRQSLDADDSTFADVARDPAGVIVQQATGVPVELDVPFSGNNICAGAGLTLRIDPMSGMRVIEIAYPLAEAAARELTEEESRMLMTLIDAALEQFTVVGNREMISDLCAIRRKFFPGT